MASIEHEICIVRRSLTCWEQLIEMRHLWDVGSVGYRGRLETGDLSGNYDAACIMQAGYWGRITNEGCQSMVIGYFRLPLCRGLFCFSNRP